MCAVFQPVWCSVQAGQSGVQWRWQQCSQPCWKQDIKVWPKKVSHGRLSKATKISDCFVSFLVISRALFHLRIRRMSTALPSHLMECWSYLWMKVGHTATYCQFFISLSLSLVDGRAILVNLYKKVILHHFNFKKPVYDIKYSPNGR